jgi:hypothetical protein
MSDSRKTDLSLLTVALAKDDPQGDLIFNVGSKEVLRFVGKTGDILHEGRKIGTDRELVDALWSLCGYAKVTVDKP